MALTIFKKIQTKLENFVRKQEVIKKWRSGFEKQKNLELKNIRKKTKNAIHQIRHS